MVAGKTLMKSNRSSVEKILPVGTDLGRTISDRASNISYLWNFCIIEIIIPSKPIYVMNPH